MDYLESNHLLSEYQFGFRKNRSTETATVLFTDEIRKAMNNGLLTGAIYIDLSKAFDTISHSILIDTLPQYGITGKAKNWLCDYLFARSQLVSYQNEISPAQPIFCGVPQGSILGPLLFIIYYNNAVNTLKKSKILIYADDTVIYFSHSNIKVIQKQLEEDFSSLAQWLDLNELVINTKKGKTEIMVFGTSMRLSKLNDEKIKIEHNLNEIFNTKSYKYLGLLLTSNLNMSEHLNKSIKKYSSRLRLLRKIRCFVDADTALSIYQAMIAPLLTYCSFSLYGSTPTHIQQKISNFESRAEILVGRKLPRRENIIKKRMCAYVHRCLHKNNVCNSFKNYFQIKTTQVNTRSNGTMLSIPKVKLNVSRSSFYFQGTVVFNDLPKYIRTEKNFTTFKTKLRDL